MKRIWQGIVWLALFISASVAWATDYTVDKDHSTVEFSVRHLFSNVKGTCDDFEGTFSYVPGTPGDWKARATVNVASINTHQPKRDAHLKSKDFFEVDTYPTMKFVSTGVTNVTPTSATLNGLLTIHGVEKPVVFDLEIRGEGKDPWGNLRSGFSATTTINRKDFGIIWNQTLETGGVLVGDEVKITLEIEGIAQAS